MTEQEFLSFLREALMIEDEDVHLAFEEELPEMVWDSTGRLIFVAALDAQHNISLTVEATLPCKSPRDLYRLISHA